MIAVINDTVKLKFAKRVTQELCQHFILTLGKIIKHEFKSNDYILIAESLSILLYFKFELLKELKIYKS